MKQNFQNTGRRMRMTWDRKAERSQRFNKKKAAKHKEQSKDYNKSKVKERGSQDDLEEWDN